MKTIHPLLHSLYLDNLDKNFCFSPYSLIECLAGLENCINGQNYREIAAWIGGEEDLTPIINKIKYSVKSHNHFFYSPEFILALNYKVINKIQKSGAVIDPILNLDWFVEQVNSIVKEKTGGKIDSLISRDEVSDLVSFAILNCIYFKADWLTKLNLELTPRLFYPANTPNDCKSTCYLNVTEDLRYFESDDYTIVELPYKDSTVSCYAVLPRGGCYPLIEKFDAIIADCARTQNVNTSVNLRIPQFKIESTLNLISALKNCGINKIFEYSKEWDLVNFEKLLPEAVLKVDAVKQKTFFDFTKDGCEAAAATIVMMYVSGCYLGPLPVKEVKNITFDRPFFYILLDKNEMKTPLFIGNVKDVD